MYGSNQPSESNQPMLSGAAPHPQMFEGNQLDFSHFFRSGGGSNTPEGELSQIPGMLPQYFKPYEQMLDPSTLMSQIGSHYQQSPGYQFSLNQALKGVGQAATAGGMAGSPQQQQQAASAAQGLASQDYGNYMQQALRLYTTGAGGYRGLGEDLASNLMSQAQLQQLQQEERDKAKEQRHSDIWGTIGTIGGAAATAAML